MAAVTTSAPRVVLIDDNQGDIELFREAVLACSSPFEVVAFQHGEEALNYLLTGIRVNLILSDLNLVKMRGDEVLEQARQIPALHMVPMVLMSSASNKGLPKTISGSLTTPCFSKAQTWSELRKLVLHIDALVQGRLDAQDESTGVQSLARLMRTPRPD